MSAVWRGVKTANIYRDYVPIADPAAEQRGQCATRIYFIVVICTLAAFASVQLSVKTTVLERVENPLPLDEATRVLTFERIQELAAEHPDLSCTCQTSSMTMSDFVNFTSRPDGVCDDITEKSIRCNDAAWCQTMATFRGSFNAMSTLCKMGAEFTAHHLQQLQVTRFISPQYIPAKKLNNQISAVVDSTWQTATWSFTQPLLTTVELLGVEKPLTGNGYQNRVIDVLNNDTVNEQTHKENPKFELAHDIPPLYMNALQAPIISSRPGDVSTWEVIAQGGYLDGKPCDCLMSYECAANITIPSSSGEPYVLTMHCSLFRTALKGPLRMFRDRAYYHTIGVPDDQTDLFLFTRPSNFADERFADAVQSVFQQQWGAEVHATRYFDRCAPNVCTYQVNRAKTMLEILTIMISLVGGVTMLARLIIQGILAACWDVRHPHAYAPTPTIAAVASHDLYTPIDQPPQ